MAYFTIKVTQQHIDKANEYIGSIDKPEKLPWCNCCAIALAAEPVVPNFIDVGQKAIIISVSDNDWGYYHLDLPQEAKDFIRKADTQRHIRAGLTKADEYDVDQEPLKPIAFSVYVPDEYVRQEN